MIQEEINRKQSEILECKSYLNATDYKIARAFETKSEIDAETLKSRAEARDLINQLEIEIKQLEKEKDENNSMPMVPTKLPD